MAPRLRLSDSTVSEYREALTRAHSRFDAQAKPMIERMRKYFKGEHWPVVPGGQAVDMKRIVANLIFADIKVMLPVLALRNPRVFVSPVGATVNVPSQDPFGQPIEVPAQIVNGKPVRLLEAARAQEALINWRWRQLQLNRATVRRVLVDALSAPFGIVKVGFTMTEEKIAGLDGESPELLEANSFVKAESPFAVRWSPLDFRVDPEARYPDLSDAGWVAFGWRARPEDVRRNPRYRNTRDLKATVEITADFDSAGGLSGPASQGRLGTRLGGSFEEDWKRVQLWEVWDKRRGKRLTLADDHDKALEWEDWPEAYENFPCETLYFTEYPDELYGPPDLYHVLGQQDAYNELSTMILNHVKRFLRKYIARRGSFDEKEMAKLIAPVDGVVAEADGEIEKAIKPLDDAAIPVDWWQGRVNFREDHDRLSAIADFMRGVAEKVDTATEASLLQSNLNVRTNDTRDAVESFAERISTQLLHIDAQTITLPAAIPVIGPDGAMAYNEYLQVADRELLLAKMDVEVEIGSMQPVDEALHKRDAIELYSLFRNDPLIDQHVLRKRVLQVYQRSMPDAQKLLLSEQEVMQHPLQRMMALQTGGAGPAGRAPGSPRPVPRPTGGPIATPPPPPVTPPEAQHG